MAKKNKSKLKIFQTPVFARRKKKLKKNQIRDLDGAVRRLMKNPRIGQKKTGGLADICVYKFKMAKEEHLLAYQWSKDHRTLIALGVHENFYRDLKKYRKD